MRRLGAVVMNEQVVQPLSRIRSGGKGTVTALTGGHAFHSRIVSMGLVVGSAIEVIQHSSGLKGPTLIATGNTRLAIGHGMAEKIMVEVETQQ